MKISKNPNPYIITALIVISCCSAIVVDPTKELDPKEVFIMQPIGDFNNYAPPKENLPNQIYHNHGSYIDYYFYDYQERYGYWIGYDNKNLKSTWSVYVFPTKKETNVKHDILLHTVSTQNISAFKPEKDKVGKSSELQIIYINSYPILISVSESIKLDIHWEKIFWQCNNVIVHLSNMKSSYQEDPALLEAYLEKYPPTWELSEADLDPEKLLKDDISRFMEITFTEMEPKRASSDKLDQFEGMLYECQFESYIRGLIKDEGKGCPIALGMDRQTRQKKFKAFEKLARGKDIDLSKMHWNRLHDLRYGEPEMLDTILKKLNMTIKDIPARYYTNYAYEE